MDTIQVDILNPKARKLLQDMQDLEAIRETKEEEWYFILEKLRAKASSAPSLEEITGEGELVRAKHYAKSLSPGING
jgi:hypothetical protein